MLYVAAIIFIIAVIFTCILALNKYDADLKVTYAKLIKQEDNLNTTNEAISKRLKELEIKLNETFFVYELARELSPNLEQEKLIDMFKKKVHEFSPFSGKNVVFSDEHIDDALVYDLVTKSPKYLSIRKGSRNLKEHLPIFVRHLNLCLERLHLYKKLQKISIRDNLTRVHNRRYLMERFYEEFDRAKKFFLNISVCMIDIDHFKKINDKYGHITGDVVLKEVAKILKENLREIDFVGRFGGEEFVLILTETDKKRAIHVAKRIVKKVSSGKIKAFDEIIKLTVSAGVAAFPENTTDAAMLIETADKALYKAKEGGRNQVSWF